MASASPLEPYNVWQDVPSSVTSKDNNITLSHIDNDDNDSTTTTTTTTTTTASSSSASGGSPTRYSVQTIRQKKGRQLVSAMMGGSDDADRNSSNGSSTGVVEGRLFPTAGSASIMMLEESTEGEGEGSGRKKTTITTTRTTTSSLSPSKPSTPAAGGAGSQDRGAGGQVGLGKAHLPHNGRGGFPSVGLYQGIGRVQAFSAMAFSSFAVIHLVPPMLASVGGVELANKALLWGRVYYQTYGLEQVLVSGSLLVHLGAGLCKAVIRLVWKAKSYYYRDSSSVSTLGAIEEGGTATIKESSTSTNVSGSTTTTTTTSTTKTTQSLTGGSGSASAPGLFPYHRLVGRILTPIVIAHMNDMRLAPLEVLGDSSMIDYSFVTYLHRIGRSGPYVLLVGLLAYHMVGGGPVAFNVVLPRWRWSVKELLESRKWRGVVAGVIVAVAMVGTGRIMYAKGAIPMSRVYLSLLDL